MINWFIILCMAYLCIFLLVRFLERRSVFFPGKRIKYTPDEIGLDYEDLYVRTSDGIEVNAWFVKNPLAVTSKTKLATIIFAHGNAGTMGERLIKIKFLHDFGVHVLAFDYRGYARSSGTPSERGVYLDAKAVFDYLSKRQDVDPAKIIAYGSSLGGAVMIDLAVKRDVAALIVESSFTSAAAIAKRLYPFLPAFMMSIKFDSVSKIKKVKVSKLILHSPRDRVIPYEMGKELFQQAKEPKSFVEFDGGHDEGGLIKDQKAHAVLENFLKEVSKQ
jgi:fermentation-respiration switch protein FrsA (DUF1100 family)